jgi:hypothetical protein
VTPIFFKGCAIGPIFIIEQLQSTYYVIVKITKPGYPKFVNAGTPVEMLPHSVGVFKAYISLGIMLVNIEMQTKE